MGGVQPRAVGPHARVTSPKRERAEKIALWRSGGESRSAVHRAVSLQTLPSSAVPERHSHRRWLGCVWCCREVQPF